MRIHVRIMRITVLRVLYYAYCITRTALRVFAITPIARTFIHAPVVTIST
eukprot:SAG25_NODE_14515_length_254_cov_0.664516_1_plen_49_part_10